MKNLILPLATGFAILALNATVAYSCNKDAIVESIVNESVRINRKPVDPKKAVKILIQKRIEVGNCNFEFVLDTIFRAYWKKKGNVFKYKYYIESSINRICVSHSYSSPEYRSPSRKLRIPEQIGEKYSYCYKI